MKLLYQLQDLDLFYTARKYMAISILANGLHKLN